MKCFIFERTKIPRLKQELGKHLQTLSDENAEANLKFTSERKLEQAVPIWFNKEAVTTKGDHVFRLYPLCYGPKGFTKSRLANFQIE